VRAELFPVFSHYLKEKENKEKNRLQDFLYNQLYLLHVTPHCLVSSINDTNNFLYSTSYILHLLWRLKIIESITYSDILVVFETCICQTRKNE